jgi:hypothetical protein
MASISIMNSTPYRHHDRRHADVDNLGITGRSAELGWIDADNRGRCSAGCRSDPVRAQLQELQLRGAETGGGPMPIDFFGLSVPA